MKLSVIVPVLDEEAALPAFMESARRWNCVDEILFVDGGSSDATPEIIREQGHTLLVSDTGRGLQCRLGALRACGDALAFVHVDSLIPASSMQAIRKALESGVTWGCLTLRFDSDKLAMRFGAWASNMRVKLTGIPFGDQVMFMTRAAYEAAGGIPAIPLMEDYELSRRLRSLSWPEQLPQEVRTSARRFEENGCLRTMADMRKLRHLYRSGANAAELARRYGAGGRSAGA